jgi:hypothetical protein
MASSTVFRYAACGPDDWVIAWKSGAASTSRESAIPAASANAREARIATALAVPFDTNRQQQGLRER